MKPIPTTILHLATCPLWKLSVSELEDRCITARMKAYQFLALSLHSLIDVVGIKSELLKRRLVKPHDIQ